MLSNSILVPLRNYSFYFLVLVVLFVFYFTSLRPYAYMCASQGIEGLREGFSSGLLYIIIIIIIVIYLVIKILIL
jgi:hypothetical protein